MRFTKMHGLGNDYVFVNTFEESVVDPAALARLVSDRHFGIGSDGLILIGPSEKADASMRIFNADGSEAEMCGNGLRCVAKYVFERGIAHSRGPFQLPGSKRIFPASLAIETGRGVLTVGLELDLNGKVRLVCVNMGQPIFDPDQIPVIADPVGDDRPVRLAISIGDMKLTAHCLSMGNPHAVIFLEEPMSVDLGAIGPMIEHLPAFPNRTNVHLVQVLNSSRIKVTTWERGSGLTLACGTGAAACCVAAAATNRTDRSVTAHLPGGDLSLTWLPADNCVYMTGPAVEVFEGRWFMETM